jgi:hypothetical protein
MPADGQGNQNSVLKAAPYWMHRHVSKIATTETSAGGQIGIVMIYKSS